MVGTTSEQVFVDLAGHIPAAPGVTITDPLVQGFADAAARGSPDRRTQSSTTTGANFGDAVNSVLDKGTDATAAIATACTTDEHANSK